MAIMRAVSTLICSFRQVVQFWSDSSICLPLPCIVLVSNDFQPVKKLLMKEVNSETVVQHPVWRLGSKPMIALQHQEVLKKISVMHELKKGS